MFVCGVINWDTLLFVQKLPTAGEGVKVDRVISVPGGKGANTAVTAVRILCLTKVGIIAMLGSDNIAEKHLAIFEGEGVDISCIMRDTSTLSGQAYVVIDSAGEDMILTHIAANQMMRSETITNQKMLSAIDKSDMMIVINPLLMLLSTFQCNARTEKGL